MALNDNVSGDKDAGAMAVDRPTTHPRLSTMSADRSEAMSDAGTRRQRANTVADPDIVLQRDPESQGRPGTVRVDLVREGRSVSSCLVVPVTICVGAARVRVDGLGEVGTPPEYRGRGYARRVITAALNAMAVGNAALSMLYGIPDFYRRFGYTTAGPRYTLSLPLADRTPRLPTGWHIRPALRTDLPAIQRLYNRASSHAVGAAVRVSHAYPWTRWASMPPAELAADCRTALDTKGRVAAYAWRDRGSWFTGHLGEDHPQSLVLAEVIARDTAAADAILAACQAWAREEAQAVGRALMAVVLAIPPEGPVAAAARHGAAAFAQTYSADGECMVRTLDPARLLLSLAPELERRLRATLPRVQGAVTLVTEVGSVTLRAESGRLSVDAGSGGASRAGASARHELTLLPLPQATLARLALGAFCAADLLARLDQPPNWSARALIEAMFPSRYPHLWIPDRF